MTMKKTALFTWLGMTDIRASRNEIDGLGPIAQACVKIGSFDEIHLLYNGEDEEAEPYKDWLISQVTSNIQLHKIELDSPIDYEAIFLAAKDTLDNYGRGKDRIYHLSPGTPAMTSIWLLLAKTTWEAGLIQSSPQRGVEAVELPFDISLDYLPSAIDNKINLMAQALPPEEPEWSDIIHQSQKMKETILRARKISQHDVPVIIQGESGTGKELFARAIHYSSRRKEAPLVAVNCGALPKDLIEAQLFGYEKGAFTGAEKKFKGYLEQADKGTIFLDELGELPLDSQVKLLRVLQDGQLRRVGSEKEISIDIRVIAATNRNLIEEISLGQFREDLFHRLAVGLIYLPALRDRKEDLNLLTDFILKKISENEISLKHKKISVSAKKLIQSHKWSGNVRELWNTLFRASIWSAGNTISEDELKEALLETKSPEDTSDNVLNHPIDNGFCIESLIAEVAKIYLEKALKESGDNKTKAAKKLGLKNYQTFTNWCKKHGVEL